MTCGMTLNLHHLGLQIAILMNAWTTIACSVGSAPPKVSARTSLVHRAIYEVGGLNVIYSQPKAELPTGEDPARIITAGSCLTFRSFAGLLLPLTFAASSTFARKKT